jgi:hypothetical protein
MNSIVEILSRLPERPLTTVVQVGVGSVMPDYRALKLRRLVLIEGDSEHAAALAPQVDAVPGAQLVASAVGPAAGRVDWHRYNLPSLNGPLKRDALQAVYPRMRLLESNSVPARSLGEVLDATAVDRPAALVFDVPGQEEALVAALRHEQLARFDWFVLRGGRPEPGGAAGLAVQRLQAHGCSVAWSNTDSEPLWPLTALRFDADRLEAQTLRERASALERQLQQQARELDELRDEVGRLRFERQQQLDPLQQLQALQAELGHRRLRQQALQDELVRAEAQINLLKDLLLREPER